jgi:hypothetical protein
MRESPSGLPPPVCSNRPVEHLGSAHDVLSETETDLYLARLPNLAVWPELREDPTWREVVEDSDAGFALFVAGDWTGYTPSIQSFATYCFEHGVFWVSTWGPECEQAHDLLDWAQIEAERNSEPENGPVVMTTWHEAEPLHKAMTLFFSAFPDEGRVAGPARIALTFGLPDWSDALRRILAREMRAAQ